jgi:parvulin-like peptidyl-prolyl isomerase
MKNRISRKKLLIITALILLAGSIGFSLSGLTSSHSASKPAARAAAEAGPDVLATVEGRQIPARLYRMYLRNGVEALGLGEQTAEGRRQIELLKEGIIGELIDRSLIESEARRRNLSIPQQAFEDAYTKRVREMGGDALYRAYLSEHALTDEEFRQSVNQEVYAQAMREELDKQITVEPSDARAFYDKERANASFAAIFVEHEAVRASHILVAARRSQITAELRAQARGDQARLDRLVAQEMGRRRARAAALLSKLNRGADFASLAREHSADPGTRDKGGDLGLFERDSHTAKFDQAAFALKPGRTSDIVETEYGYHIIKVSEHRPERTRSFDEARAAIEKHLLARKRAAHLKRWLEERRAAASIQVDAFYAAGQYRAGKS